MLKPGVVSEIEMYAIYVNRMKPCNAIGQVKLRNGGPPDQPTEAIGNGIPPRCTPVFTPEDHVPFKSGEMLREIVPVKSNIAIPWEGDEARWFRRPRKLVIQPIDLPCTHGVLIEVSRVLPHDQRN